MAVPVDSAHGMIGKIEAGDRVDVITTQDAGAGSLTAASVAARNSLVLAVPTETARRGARDEQVTIRVPDDAAAAIAAAADGGEVWLRFGRRWALVPTRRMRSSTASRQASPSTRRSRSTPASGADDVVSHQSAGRARWRHGPELGRGRVAGPAWDRARGGRGELERGWDQIASDRIDAVLVACGAALTAPSRSPRVSRVTS